MVELRKRREAPSAGSEPPLKKSSSATKAKADPGPAKSASRVIGDVGAGNMLKVGSTVEFDGFGGEVETQDGDMTNLKMLVNDSKNGVVLFTYPKASTPGCTTQACLFRDEYTSLTATGYSIFGLSTDSPRSNTTFKIKQRLPFTLLCNPNATLIGAIGMKKIPKGTTRGVFVVSKTGRVEAVESGGPAATVEVVRKLINDAGKANGQTINNMVKMQAVQNVSEADDIEAQDGAGPASSSTSGSSSSTSVIEGEKSAPEGHEKKYTVRSTGIWDRIRRALAIDPNRSSGVPLNPQYRNPPPGANPPQAYDDPVTVPAGDIAENAYFRRDIRRSYPRPSVVKQADVVGLLSVGSKAKPKEDVLQIGDAGAEQLVQVQRAGEDKGLSAFFEKEKTSVASILGPTGLPPFPTGASLASPEGGRKYIMDVDRENGYPEE
ncbi:MAG: hypothetical protein Q9202_004645 [Teloschistes flavicans]